MQDSIGDHTIYRMERRFTADLQYKYNYMNNECPSVEAGVKSANFWLIFIMLTFSNCIN